MADGGDRQSRGGALGRGGGRRGRGRRGGPGRGRGAVQDPEKQAQLRLREAVVKLERSREAVEKLVQQALVNDAVEWPTAVRDAVCDAAAEMPNKSGVYAFLLSLLNANAPEFGLSVVHTLHSRLMQCATGYGDAAFRAHHLTRVIGLLYPARVLTADSVISIYTSLIDSAISLEASDSEHWQARADQLVHCVLAALPYVARMLQPAAPELFEQMHARVREYLACQRQAAPGGLEGEDLVQEYWEALQPLLESPSWVVPGTENLLESHAVNGAVSGKPHSLSQPSKPAVDVAAAFSSRELPGAFLQQRPQLHATSAVPSDRYALERLVAEDLIDATIWAFEERATSHDGVHLAAHELLSLKPVVQFDCKQLIAERLFSEMLALPVQRFRPVFYTTIINNLCTADGSFAKCIGTTVGSLFRSLERLDNANREMLAQFLAHHLSVFRIGWPWQRWEHVCEQKNGSAQREFVRSTLDRLVRLTFRDRVKQALPESMHELLPPAKPYYFPYEQQHESSEELHDVEHEEDAQSNGVAAWDGTSASKEIIRRIREEKQPAEDLFEWLQSTIQPELGTEETFDTLAYTLLHIGSKTPTHLSIALNRYGSTIERLVPSHDHTRLLDAVAQYWQGSPQNLCLTLDRLVQHELANTTAILQWAFGNALPLHSGSSECARGLREFVEHSMAVAVSKLDCANNAVARGRQRYQDAEAAVQRHSAPADSLALSKEPDSAQASQSDEQRVLAERERCEAELNRCKDEHATAEKQCNVIIETVFKLYAHNVDIASDEQYEQEVSQLRSVLRRYKPFVPSEIANQYER